MLLHPEWLALLPVILLAGWWLRGVGMFRPLRLVLVVLIVLLAARPQWRLLGDGVDLWVLVDRSQSAEKALAAGFEEWRDLLERAKGGSDRIFYLPYAGEVLRQGTTGAELHERDRGQTRTGLAVTAALAHAQRESAGRAARALVITDGYATEPLDGVAEKLARQGVELDYRLMREAEVVDFRVAAVQAPTRVQPGEPFLLEVEVRGGRDGQVPLSITRAGRELIRTEVEVKEGRGVGRFTDRVTGAGAAEYVAEIVPARDAHSGNNRGVAVVEAAGGRRALLLTNYPDDPIAEVLRGQGMEVEVVTSFGGLNAARLAGARCVIFNNVAAYDLPTGFLAALDFHVREQGNSVLMAGGERSFASGGYFESPLDPLLPVSMELKQEHRKLLVAMAIVLDRSGSMSMTVQRGFTKMQLADEGAANAVRFLGARDMLGVLAVDSQAHIMVPMQVVGPNREKMEEAVRRIESMGGGIFVYEGLSAAWKQLKAVPAGQRHIILFSDAADSEEPGDYQKLLKEITDAGGTVSVIALGTRADADAALLEDIAKLGKGRLFFTDKAEEVPSLFSQETVAVARSAFLRDPVKTKGTTGWLEISGQAAEWPGELDGYNLSYLREWATQALIAGDEYAAPLVAYGQRGVGRTAAVSFPLGGKYSERARGWAGYGDFVQTLVRWLMGEDQPAGIGLKHRIEGSALKLDLYYDDSWEAKLAGSGPRVLLAGAGAEGQRELAWERLEPGHYQATTELQQGQWLRGAVRVGRQALPFGPVVLGNSTEWAFDERRVQELRNVARVSGGREIVDPRQAWRSPVQPRFADLSGWLLVVTLVLLLAEALVTRTGWKPPVWERRERAAVKPIGRSKAKGARGAGAREVAASIVTAGGQGNATGEAANANAAAEERERRFARAKRR